MQDTAPKAIWFNMRKEPIIYVNGSPAAPRFSSILAVSLTLLARYPDDLHKNLEMQFPAEDLDNLQSHYLKHLHDTVKDSPDKTLTVIDSVTSHLTPCLRCTRTTPSPRTRWSGRTSKSP